jgi:hypothetical protein
MIGSSRLALFPQEEYANLFGLPIKARHHAAGALLT